MSVASPPLELGRLMDGFITTQLLRVAAALGVADALADGSRTGSEVAAALGAGFAVERVVATDSPQAVSVIEAVPAP